jgi:hypothetical protein
MSGALKIWKMKPIEMKVIATPAKAERSAARGVCRRSQPPKKEVASSITPPRNPATSETRQASVASCVSRQTGARIKKMKAKRLTVLTPNGSAVTGRPVRCDSRRACQA